jgi:hypothetical protein
MARGAPAGDGAPRRSLVDGRFRPGAAGGALRNCSTIDAESRNPRAWRGLGSGQGTATSGPVPLLFGPSNSESIVRARRQMVLSTTDLLRLPVDLAHIHLDTVAKRKRTSDAQTETWDDSEEDALSPQHELDHEPAVPAAIGHRPPWRPPRARTQTLICGILQGRARRSACTETRGAGTSSSSNRACGPASFATSNIQRRCVAA